MIQRATSLRILPLCCRGKHAYPDHQHVSRSHIQNCNFLSWRHMSQIYLPRQIYQHCLGGNPNALLQHLGIYLPYAFPSKSDFIFGFGDFFFPKGKYTLPKRNLKNLRMLSLPKPHTSLLETALSKEQQPSTFPQKETYLDRNDQSLTSALFF